MAVHPRLSDDLRQRGYGQHFQQAWLDPFHNLNKTSPAERAESLEDYAGALPEPAARAALSVLSSLKVGRNLIGRFADRLGPGSRFLDVGCGFGGSLVAASEEGADVYGIELSRQRIQFANALLADHGIDNRVFALDVFKPAFDDLAPFDVICSINVIEHVSDPRRFITRLASRLKPGGLLFMEIPNKDSALLVANDPHYGIPLLTQLSHHSAKATFNQTTGGHDAYGMPYDVGDYYELSWYLAVFADAGLKTDVVWRENAIATAAQIEAARQRIAQATHDVTGRFKQVDPFLREELRLAGQRYLANVIGDEHRSKPAAWLVFGHSLQEE